MLRAYSRISALTLRGGQGCARHALAVTAAAGEAARRCPARIYELHDPLLAGQASASVDLTMGEVNKPNLDSASAMSR